MLRVMPGPLEGIRVIDFGRFIAGPYCAMLLADFGADVIRVERREGGEDRKLGPVTESGELFVSDAASGTHREPSRSGADVGHAPAGLDAEHIHDAVNLQALVPSWDVEDGEVAGIRRAGPALRRRFS